MFGSYGELAYDPNVDRVQCHICGGWLKQLAGLHLSKAHGITADQYRRDFGLSSRNPLCRPATSAMRRAHLERRMETDDALQESMAAAQARVRSGELALTSAAARRGKPNREESARKKRAILAAVDKNHIGASKVRARELQLAETWGARDFAMEFERRLASTGLAGLMAEGLSREWVVRAARRHQLTHLLPGRVGLQERVKEAAQVQGFPDAQAFLDARLNRDAMNVRDLAKTLGVGSKALASYLLSIGLAAPHRANTAERRLASFLAATGYEDVGAYRRDNLDATLLELARRAGVSRSSFVRALASLSETLSETAAN